MTKSNTPTWLVVIVLMTIPLILIFGDEVLTPTTLEWIGWIAVALSISGLIWSIYKGYRHQLALYAALVLVNGSFLVSRRPLNIVLFIVAMGILIFDRLVAANQTSK